MNNFEKIKKAVERMDIAEMSMRLEEHFTCNYDCPMYDICTHTDKPAPCNKLMKKWLESPTEESE